MKTYSIAPWMTTVTVILFVTSHVAFSQPGEIKSTLKNVSVRRIEGNALLNFDIADRVGKKILIIEFWETWCSPCISAMRHLQELEAEFQSEVDILCVSSDDVTKAMNFIGKNSYSFDFIFDQGKQLSAMFPHKGIPHTVIIDKNGELQAETNPNFISSIHLKQLINGKSIDVPSMASDQNTKTTNSDASLEPGLVSFTLGNAKLGDKPTTSVTSGVFNKRIITEYSPTGFRDTTETIKSYTGTAQTILNIYQFAYGGISEDRFIFSKDLNPIKSRSPNNLYNLEFNASDLFGEFHSLMLHQLNAVFGLMTEKVVVDTAVLVLDRVVMDGKTIKPANPDGGRLSASIYQISFDVEGDNIDPEQLASLIERKMHLPVKVNIEKNISYSLDISIEDSREDVDSWLALFRKAGVYLRRDSGSVEFITLKKKTL